MGASKRVAELFVQALSIASSRAPTSSPCASATCSAASGSVVPIFQRADRKRRAGHRHAPRDDALLHDHPRGLAARAAGGGDGRGRRDLRARHGRAGEDRRPRPRHDPPLRPAPREDIEIEFTGMRPGEKLFEELEAHGEQMKQTRHPKIMIGQLQPADSDVLELAVRTLVVAADRGDPVEVRAALSELLPEATLGGQGKPTAPPAQAAPRTAAITVVTA